MTVGLQDLGETVHGTSRIELCSIPVRSVHASGHGLCGARNPNGQGRAAHDSAFCRRHRRVRSCLPQFDDVKLSDVPGLQKLLPFVRKHIPDRHGMHGKTVRVRALDLAARKWKTRATPFMPFLFSSAIHDALAEVRWHLWEETLVRMSDVYVPHPRTL